MCRGGVEEEGTRGKGRVKKTGYGVMVVRMLDKISKSLEMTLHHIVSRFLTLNKVLTAGHIGNRQVKNARDGHRETKGEEKKRLYSVTAGANTSIRRAMRKGSGRKGGQAERV